MKKTLLSLLLLFSLLLLTGCGTVGSESESVIEGSLEELLAKVTEGVEPDIMVMETPLTQENFSSYLFIDYVEGSEGLASDAAINAIAHSVVLLRLPEGADAAEIQKEIEENLNPRKWVCVEAESSKVARHGNLILVAMSSRMPSIKPFPTSMHCQSNSRERGSVEWRFLLSLLSGRKEDQPMKQSVLHSCDMDVLTAIETRRASVGTPGSL